MSTWTNQRNAIEDIISHPQARFAINRLGTKYVGQYSLESNKPDGQGVSMSTDGVIRYGGFKRGYHDGMGGTIYPRQGGDACHEGVYSNNQPHGPGAVICESLDGDVMERMDGPGLEMGFHTRQLVMAN